MTPVGREAAVEMDRVAVTVMLNCLVAVTERLSLSCTVKVNTPAALRVPVMAPAAERANPVACADALGRHRFAAGRPTSDAGTA